MSELGKPTAQTTRRSKWTNVEIMALHDAVKKFGDDVESIARAVRTRTAQQVQQRLLRDKITEARKQAEAEKAAAEAEAEKAAAEAELKAEAPASKRAKETE